jgi:formiminotetrahydrofolate cyclodeaminase
MTTSRLDRTGVTPSPRPDGEGSPTEEVIDPTRARIGDWLGALAGRSGVPGGGAASALMLGIGAAQLEMTARYSDGDGDLQALIHRTARLRREAVRLCEVDAVSSGELGRALASEEDAPSRDAAIRDAAAGAAASSLSVAIVGSRLVVELEQLEPRVAESVRADLAVAAEAIGAGLGGAIANLHADSSLRARHSEGSPRDAIPSDAVADAERSRMTAAGVAARCRTAHAGS